MRDYELCFGELLGVFPPNPLSEPGIYCIFAAEPGHDNLEKLIYIGKAEDMKDRFDDHEKIGDWKKAAGSKKLYCSIAWLSDISENVLSKIEHEMIYRYQPIVNIQCKNNPPENRPDIDVTGPIRHFCVVNP